MNLKSMRLVIGFVSTLLYRDAAILRTAVQSDAEEGH